MAEIERQMMRLALEARRCAYAPYSDYQVGAALLTEDGRVYVGGNIENASYGATICAERTAAAKAVSEGARRFRMIAIAGGSGEHLNMAYPCGICRQALREFCDPESMIVLVGISDEKYRKFTLEELLPESFGPDFKAGMD
ncbi:MAG: cytidine deaminase [Lachnospiraceae bacterium]|nr:cytidine deaminase [Lachnospiraceae bacterium]